MLTTARMQLLAWVLQVQTPSRGGRHRSENHIYAGYTHIFGRDRTTHLIKCIPWSTRFHPHPTIIKKMKTFLEVEGKMGPIPAPDSQFRPPLPDTNPNIRKNNVAEKRKRATPKKFRPATPKPTTAHLPLPEAPPKPKMMHPYLLYHPMRALHGLAQARWWLTYLRTEIGCSHQITWTTSKRTRQKMNLKLQPMSQAPSLRLKKMNLRQVNNPQKNAVGDQVAPFCKFQEEKEEQCKMQSEKLSSKGKQQATRPKRLS